MRGLPFYIPCVKTFLATYVRRSAMLFGVYVMLLCSFRSATHLSLHPVRALADPCVMHAGISLHVRQATATLSAETKLVSGGLV